jgi:hypothetical protein
MLALPPPRDELDNVGRILCQCAASGRMGRDELNSLREFAPRLVTTIAENLPECWPAAPAGTKIRNLVRLADEGRLTAAMIWRGMA